MRRSLAVLAIGLALFGCGRGEIRGRITGKVTFQGQPVSEGLVVFGNSQTGTYMTAKLKADGSYEVLTAKGPGLPLETYQVCISPPVPKVVTGVNDDVLETKPYPNIPLKYRDAKTSGLTLTVVEGVNVCDIAM